MPSPSRPPARNVVAAGLTERVRPAVQDASDPGPRSRYNLVTIFKALHDMNHPVEALRTARDILADGGSVVIADERVAERFTAPGDEIERFNYGWSALHCIAVVADETAVARVAPVTHAHVTSLGRYDLHRQPPPAGHLRPLRRPDGVADRAVLTPPLGVSGDKH